MQRSELQSWGWKFHSSKGQLWWDKMTFRKFSPIFACKSILWALPGMRSFTFPAPSASLVFQTAPGNLGTELAQGCSHQHLLTVASLSSLKRNSILSAEIWALPSLGKGGDLKIHKQWYSAKKKQLKLLSLGSAERAQQLMAEATSLSQKKK